MGDHCKYLEYRRHAGDEQFDTDRAYCNAVDQFVQPMRADICNYRYGLEPEQDCEYYEDAESSAEDQRDERSEK